MESARARAAPVAAREILLRFTSLGDNCEFGLAQRRAGAEPLGLFRLASCALESLIAALGDGFADLDPLERIEVVRPWGDEFITYFGARGFYHHTLKTLADTDAAALRAREAVRIPFLRRRMLEDLQAGETIFVRKSDTLDPAGMHRLHAALQRHGRNRLLWVEPAGGHDPPGTVEMVAPDLYRGALDRMAPYGDAAAISFDGWLRLCLGVLDRLGVTPPAGAPPTPRQAGVEVALGGWEGVACTPGAPVPPLRPGTQSFTHASGAARTCCGAVLNPNPRLEVGVSYVGSVYVWLAEDFRGAGIAPVLTHIPRAHTQVAILQERGRWQRIWVAAAIPHLAATVDFGLWLQLAAGDRFYSTEWCLERADGPGDYWLQPSGGLASPSAPP